MSVRRSLLTGKKDVKYYKSIHDLPSHNWFQISKSNDLIWLLHDQDDLAYTDDTILEPLWDKIFSEFIDTFGIPDKMREILETKRDIQCWKWDIIINNDKSFQTFIDVAEQRLTLLFKQEEEDTAGQLKAYMAKFIGSWPDDKKMSVYDYYSCIKAMEKANKPARASMENDNGGE